MPLKPVFWFFLGLFFLFVEGVEAQVTAPRIYTRDDFQDIRWLGRGNTGVASINDGTSIFYNPGGIGRVESYSFSLLNPSLGGGQNIYDSFSHLSNLGSGNGSLTSDLGPLLGKPLGLKTNLFPHLAVPGLVVGMYYNLDTALAYRDPVYPQFETDYRYDFGLAAGTGFKIGPYVSIGTSLRYIERTSINQTISGQSAISASASTLNQIKKTGKGFGLNVGSQFLAPLGKHNRLLFGVAVEDVGQTRFFKTAFANDAKETLPLKQIQKVNTGMSYEIYTKFFGAKILADYKNVADLTESATKKFFLGVDVGLPVVDVRGGFYNGYWSSGVSMTVLPFLEMDVTTYAEELDSSAGLRSNRFWMIGFRSGMELKKNESRKQKFTLDNL